MCYDDNFTGWTRKIVVGKSWVMKLRKIDMEGMGNELASDSNDSLYFFSVFTLLYGVEIFGVLFGRCPNIPD